jgi:FkbM family methyltransferase
MQPTDLQNMVDNFLKFYSENKHLKELNQITEFLLSHALSARGYNNYRNNQESGESYFIKEILAKTNPKLCIDVGANIGEYTKEILENTNSKVIAFEPVPTTFEKLRKETEFYSDRIIYENLGVGAFNEDLIIHFNSDALAHASFSEEVKQINYVSNEEKVSVPVVTLDTYLKNKNITQVDFIKIDTEGFESEVFKGAIRIFTELKPKYIQIEFNWHQLFRNTSLHYFSQQLPGYEMYQLIPNGWVLRDSKDPLVNIYSYSNFIFSLK